MCEVFSDRSNNPRVRKVRVSFPTSIAQQREFVRTFREILEQTKRLESLYRRKITALDELKKSLLHRAFSGELTGHSTAVVVPAALAGPIELPGISTTDLHAGILAMAHELHEEAGRLKNFGHVKGEKIAHMIEARLGISLGCQPIKDAAGSNDFDRLKKVEARARKAGYFEVKRLAGGGYRIHKLAGFDGLLDKTRAALGERLADVDRLLQWMLPLDSKQAELVATVFAAWNNLLLDGKQPTDEEIVCAARDDWHPKKLRIKLEKFFAAIEWLREHNAVPEGRGVRVVAKGDEIDSPPTGLHNSAQCSPHAPA